MNAFEKKTCGIVMPISAMDGYTESHWVDVLNIITDSIEAADFEGDLVSNADDVGIIHQRIIQNLYNNPVVVCDVSGKNPNVMFELGLRLAFDKPTIIIKDDKTSYSFDTSSIEHLEYPRDLRFGKIVEFKKKLTEKIRATHQKATSDPHFTTFLKHFGEFKVAKIEEKEVSGQEYILEELKNIRRTIARMERTRESRSDIDHNFPENQLDICLLDAPDSKRSEAMAFLMNHPAVESVGMKEREPGHYHLTAFGSSPTEMAALEKTVREMLEISFRRRGPRNKKSSGDVNETGH